MGMRPTTSVESLGTNLLKQALNHNYTIKSLGESTLSKTPPNTEGQFLTAAAAAAAMILSPMIFKHNSESRFTFARSVDPSKYNDLEEIHVPENIQDLIERNIRSLSNSITHKSTEGAPKQSLFSHEEEAFLDRVDFQEKWLTKKELKEKLD